MAENRRTEKSWSAHRRSKQYLAGGSSTNSKAPLLEGAEPALIVRGKGCRVWDADGNEYIDFRNSLGPVTLGYAIPEINRAISEQLERGIVFGHPHPLEGEVAELLCSIIPCAERARFLKTGGEAIAACIKIARHATGRNRVAHCGYNGWLNSLSRPRGGPRALQSAHPERGVPAALSALHSSLPWADSSAWETHFAEEGKDIAAAVVACDYAEMEKAASFLPWLRKLTSAHGSLLILDEIVTGFRVALGGAQERFGVRPDMAVFGKGMANGMPISAYLGRAQLMDEAPHIGISSTFGGETLSLAASRAAIAFYRERGVIEHLWRMGKLIWEGLEALAREAGFPLTVRGLPVCPSLRFGDSRVREAFLRGCYANGVSLYDVPYVCFSHTESDAREALERMRRAIGEARRALGEGQGSTESSRAAVR